MARGYGKSGISWPVQERTSDPIAKFFQEGSKLSWHWNWNKNWKSILPETSKDLTIDAEFVAMIFAPDYLDNGVELDPSVQIVMGYNEPDHNDASVAVHQSARDAAIAWTHLAKLRETHGVKLASPAIAGNIPWLQEWFAQIPDDTRPDYLTVHIYTTTFDDFVRQVVNFWNLFRLPIIVSEFAMHSFAPGVPPPTDMQQVHDFMGQITQWLDQTDFIAKYSWFGAVRDGYNLHGVSPLNRLMDEHGELTALGQQYVAGGHA
ncbi:hypothetical protein DB88DRAFT_480850 [Papiliotrema laurentii]|uniref:Asl1-like glycosyl hydrolase catalytic domain-containing protein n=1 Tax=Papiliotrema laurentii TaxID=5418 RepID=A0AAD9FU01_PAPLA|nr:hypothetical protein DB88DRAFT_480850 [Papiliotrema laurentii]